MNEEIEELEVEILLSIQNNISSIVIRSEQELNEEKVIFLLKELITKVENQPKKYFETQKTYENN